MEDILIGQFTMTLPTTFKKIQGNQRNLNNEDIAWRQRWT